MSRGINYLCCKMSKYQVPYNEDEKEVLPNLLNISNKEEIGQQEFIGFSRAELFFVNELSDDTIIDVDYIVRLHKLALEHLYSFAGKLRSVNLSKGSFMFPAAAHLNASMEEFGREILVHLPRKYTTKEQLIDEIAKVHAELLFIHPFREGNGRTARLLANIMMYQAGYEVLDFGKLHTDERFQQYITAVQAAALKNYDKMKEVITFIFPE